jgi:hypothetical protein
MMASIISIIDDLRLSQADGYVMKSYVPDILLLVFGLLFLVGLIVFRFRFIKDRNPNAKILIDLLRWMNAPR